MSLPPIPVTAFSGINGFVGIEEKQEKGEDFKWKHNENIEE